jgi:hypothetical protein
MHRREENIEEFKKQVEAAGIQVKILKEGEELDLP